MLQKTKTALSTPYLWKQKNCISLPLSLTNLYALSLQVFYWLLLELLWLIFAPIWFFKFFIISFIKCFFPHLLLSHPLPVVWQCLYAFTVAIVIITVTCILGIILGCAKVAIDIILVITKVVFFILCEKSSSLYSNKNSVLLVTCSYIHSTCLHVLIAN